MIPKSPNRYALDSWVILPSADRRGLSVGSRLEPIELTPITGMVRAPETVSAPSSLLFDRSVADCFEGDVFIRVRFINREQRFLIVYITVLAVELEEAESVLVIPHSESSMYSCSSSCGLKELKFDDKKCQRVSLTTSPRSIRQQKRQTQRSDQRLPREQSHFGDRCTHLELELNTVR